MKNYYIVGIVEKSRKAKGDFLLSDKLDLTWADGQVGVCAVFTNKKKAIKYAGRSDIIIKTVEVEEN